ncbi:MAG: hypothetical protein IKY61_07155, partial [Thermoguttaceae bacterium]|nr:hypothetical protein [Thermoguttaceae bacterium]
RGGDRRKKARSTENGSGFDACPPDVPAFVEELEATFRRSAAARRSQVSRSVRPLLTLLTFLLSLATVDGKSSGEAERSTAAKSFNDDETTSATLKRAKRGK